MHVSEFQADVARTLQPGPKSQVLLIMALGLNGEAGEIAEEIKKASDQQRPLDKDKLILEMGDFLFYLGGAAELTGKPLVLFAATFGRPAKLPILCSIQLSKAAALLAESLEAIALTGRDYTEGINSHMAIACNALMHLADCLEVDMDTVMERNVAKRQARHPHGWTAQGSVERVDVNG